MANNFTTYTDDQLLGYYREDGDKRYLGELYKRYAHLVLGLCLKYLKDEEKARDAVVDIFELIMEKLLHNDVLFFRSWLYIVAKHHLLRIIRKNKESIEVSMPGDEIISGNFMENGEEIAPNTELEYVEVREQQLHEALSELKEDHQVCIRQFYFEKRSYAEIASATGFDLKQVKSFIQNGKRNLKLILEEKRFYK
jgi:RNA polymerase sigma-70 factor, ECF subfamily